MEISDKTAGDLFATVVDELRTFREQTERNRDSLWIASLREYLPDLPRDATPSDAGRALAERLADAAWVFGASKRVGG